MGIADRIRVGTEKLLAKMRLSYEKDYCVFVVNVRSNRFDSVSGEPISFSGKTCDYIRFRASSRILYKVCDQHLIVKSVVNGTETKRNLSLDEAEDYIWHQLGTLVGSIAQNPLPRYTEAGGNPPEAFYRLPRAGLFGNINEIQIN